MNAIASESVILIEYRIELEVFCIIQVESLVFSLFVFCMSQAMAAYERKWNKMTEGITIMNETDRIKRNQFQATNDRSQMKD